MTWTLTALLAALALAAPAGATLTRNAGLEQKALSIRGTPITVWCESDPAAWAKLPWGNLAAYTSGGPEVWLSPKVCSGLAEPPGGGLCFCERDPIA